MGHCKTLQKDLQKPNSCHLNKWIALMGPSVMHQRRIQKFFTYTSRHFDREAIYDESVLEEVPQYYIHQHCDYRPTDEEVRAAARKLKNNALGESGIMPQILKCLPYHQETFFTFENSNFAILGFNNCFCHCFSNMGNNFWIIEWHVHN